MCISGRVNKILNLHDNWSLANIFRLKLDSWCRSEEKQWQNSPFKADSGMRTIFLIAGILVTAAGALALAFGLPINAFEFGNTLIVSGTVAFVGGLLLIGFAMAIRELQIIAKHVVHDRPRSSAQSSDNREADKGEIPFPISKVLKRASRREAETAPVARFSPDHHEELSDLSIAPAEPPA